MFGLGDILKWGLLRKGDKGVVSEDDLSGYLKNTATGISDALAIGANATASGAGALAIGKGASGKALLSVAMGSTANAEGQSSVAVGLGAKTSGRYQLALGYSSRITALSDGAIQLGTGTISSNDVLLQAGAFPLLDHSGRIPAERGENIVAAATSRNYPIVSAETSSSAAEFTVSHNTVLALESTVAGGGAVSFQLETPDFDALGGQVFVLDYVVAIRRTEPLENFELSVSTADGDTFVGDSSPASLEAGLYLFTFTRVRFTGGWVCRVSVQKAVAP